MFGIDIGAVISGAIAENRAKKMRVPLGNPHLEALLERIEKSPIPKIRIYGSGLGLPDLSFRERAKEPQKREDARGGVSLADEKSAVGAVSVPEDKQGALSEVKDKK